MIKPSILLLTAESFLTGFGAKTLVDDSSARAAAAKRLPGVVAEAEIKNVSKLCDVLGRLNKTVAAICQFKLEALAFDEAEHVDIVPSR